MAPDLIALKASPADDPDGSRLNQVLWAHLALESASAARELLVHLVAVLSVPVGLVAAEPGWLSPLGRRLALAAWLLSALAAAGAFVRESHFRRARDRQAAPIRVDSTIHP